jgi:[acyl-carrier-protein] S-malonyltransferase
MALDFLEKGDAALTELFAAASSVMGQDMKVLLEQADAQTLKRTDIAQVALTLANLAAASFLRRCGIVPRVVAGFSLGEYAALESAGVISTDDCFSLVKKRGQVMQDAVDSLNSGDSKPSGMAAVMGLSPDQVEALVAQWTEAGLSGLYCANFNSPLQTVVSGTAAALQAAEERFKEAGAKRVIPLKVAGPFHSPLMAQAAELFGPALAEVQFNDPLIPLYSNVSGKLIRSASEAKALALKHITAAVRWTAEEEAIALAGGIDGVLEAGPGNVLRGMWKESGTSIPCYAAGTVADIEALPAIINY